VAGDLLSGLRWQEALTCNKGVVRKVSVSATRSTFKVVKWPEHETLTIRRGSQQHF